MATGSGKIRLGIIGANIHLGWAPRSHLPAVAASPEFELTAVCTTRMESAEESARAFGARLAFDNYQDLIDHPEIDAVAVVLRVPSHYEPTMAALKAGKHVYTEWPLGQTTAQAQEMAELAQAKGVRNLVGLQAREAPTIKYMKELVEQGYVGEVLSCNLSLVRGGSQERHSTRTWQRDDELGAHTLTIACGHSIDALRYVVGDFSHVSGVVSTQTGEWYETDTDQRLPVTSPDNILVSGRLKEGGVASLHVASNPWAGSGLRMEIYGSKGTLAATSVDSPQLREMELSGVQGPGELQPMEAPGRLVNVLESMPKGEALNVGQMYYQFGQAIRAGQDCQPDFATAVDLHRLVDGIRRASDEGREVAVG